jgi:hypothetical protein
MKKCKVVIFMYNFFLVDSKGYLKKRESFDLEYKQNFQLGDNLLKYIKTLAGMANNKGGKIIFGVQDSPHIPKGMTNNKFHETDPKTIDKTIREYFSQELIWTTDTYKIGEKEFGILIVDETENKPIICKKNKEGVLREGAIYYRYRGETKEVEYAELQKILEKEREKEKLLWLRHITQISTIGPKNVQLLDTYKGEIATGDGKILIDKNIIDKIKFIQEGKFVEKEGAPTLKLIGEISGIIDTENILPNDKVYPLFTKDLQEQLNLNSHEIKCLLWKLKIKEKPKYHSEIKTSGKTKCHKYSENLVPLLERLLLKDSNYLSTCKAEYKKDVLDKQHKRNKKLKRQ